MMELKFDRSIHIRSLSENRESTTEKPFWSIFPLGSLNMSNYSPQMIEKLASKWLPLATVPVLGQAPSSDNDDIILGNPIIGYTLQANLSTLQRVFGVDPMI